MPLGITKGIATWNSQQHTVERYTDNSAYTSAHPDDTLVLAGPPRKADMLQEATSGWESLLAIGMMQGFQFTSQKPTQPLQAIGSGRAYFVSGKSQTTWRIGRLFCNGRNLLRVLYHNAVAGGVPVQSFDDPAVAQDPSEIYYANLDSELYYVPFGLGAIFRDKIKDLIGAVYLELCMVQTYGVGFNAGQQMVMEDVSGMCDRVLPFRPTAVAAGSALRQTVDTVIGFINDKMPTSGTGLLDGSLADSNVSP
jgi:hypothetical protein